MEALEKCRFCSTTFGQEAFLLKNLCGTDSQWQRRPWIQYKETSTAYITASKRSVPRDL